MGEERRAGLDKRAGCTVESTADGPDAGEEERGAKARLVWRRTVRADDDEGSARRLPLLAAEVDAEGRLVMSVAKVEDGVLQLASREEDMAVMKGEQEKRCPARASFGPSVTGQSDFCLSLLSLWVLLAVYQHFEFR